MKAWQLIKHLEEGGVIKSTCTKAIEHYKSIRNINVAGYIVNRPEEYEIIPKENKDEVNFPNSSSHKQPINCDKHTKNVSLEEIFDGYLSIKGEKCEEGHINGTKNVTKDKLPCAVCAYNEELKDSMSNRLTDIIDDICRVRARLRDGEE